MLDTLISSKTRIKLLLKFFLNSSSRSYLRSLESEFGESTNAIRLELNRFEDAGMLESEKKGNRKYFKANTQHPLFGEVQKIMQKYVGIDQIIERVVDKLGNLEKVYLEGSFAKGLDAEVIDLILIGKEIDRQYLTLLINKAEEVIDKRIRYVLFEPGKEKEYLKNQQVKPLLIWGKANQ
ncbi:MAG TPA: ArsR family transcriptional regulator [Flavobacteriaceae bacterium]|nr:ArsR family transcriptional regulator [Flavobacteriaceae bacterium]